MIFVFVLVLLAVYGVLLQQLLWKNACKGVFESPFCTAITTSKLNSSLEKEYFIPIICI